MYVENSSMQNIIARVQVGKGWRVKMPDMVQQCANDTICLLACDEYSFWILDYNVVQSEINKIKEPLGSKLIKADEEEKIKRDLIEIYNSIIAVKQVDSDRYFELGDIYHLLTDDEIYFRNVYGRIKMYLGKEAFLKSMNTNSYKK